LETSDGSGRGAGAGEPAGHWDVTTLDYLRYGPLLLETGDTAATSGFGSRRWRILPEPPSGASGARRQGESVDAGQRGFSGGVGTAGGDGVKFAGHRIVGGRMAGIVGKRGGRFRWR